jgi:hypothetical protein
MAQRRKAAVQSLSDSPRKKYGIIFAELMEKIPSKITQRIIRRRRKDFERAGLQVDPR